jgi:hypothetical protein
MQLNRQGMKEINNTQLKHLASFTLKISPFPLQTPCTKQLVSVTLFFQCGSFDVWRKLRELRSVTLGMESRKANISSFVLRGGSEVMFWEPQNSSLHHKGGEFLFPTVAESECTNYKQHVELQACMNKPGERVENCPLKGFASCQSLTRRNSLCQATRY